MQPARLDSLTMPCLAFGQSLVKAPTSKLVTFLLSFGHVLCLVDEIQFLCLKARSSAILSDEQIAGWQAEAASYAAEAEGTSSQGQSGRLDVTSLLVAHGLFSNRSQGIRGPSIDLTPVLAGC